jgi:hypothetical protein
VAEPSATVTEIAAVTDPTAAVIVDVPSATEMSRPVEAVTVATAASEDVQVIV